jgi:hypothetical protein
MGSGVYRQVRIEGVPDLWEPQMLHDSSVGWQGLDQQGYISKQFIQHVMSAEEADAAISAAILINRIPTPPNLRAVK